MHVISVVSLKGGVGKTTLASALAVRAASDSKRVAMVDLDPQLSLVAWWKRRGSSDNPCILSGADTASDAVDSLNQTGWDWVFIDTPPAFFATIEDAVENADVIIIPIRASALDLSASEDAVVMARDSGKPYLCVINDAEPRWKTTTAARDYLRKAGVPVAETIVAHRQPFLSAMASGKSGAELDKNGAGSEIDALWKEVKALVAKAKRSTTKQAAKGGAK